MTKARQRAMVRTMTEAGIRSWAEKGKIKNFPVGLLGYYRE